MNEYISRKEAIASLKRIKKRNIKHGEILAADEDAIIEWLKSLPSVQPERKKGSWEIYIISMFDGEGCRCSECKFEGAPQWHFCPNCGAKMEGVKKDEAD